MTIDSSIAGVIASPQLGDGNGGLQRPRTSETATRPTVGIVVRSHLAPSETFIQNQLTSLQRHRPIVLAHHRRTDTDVALEEGAVARELLTPSLARADELMYRLGRTPLPQGMGALARYARQQDTRLLHFHFLTDARFMVGLQRRTGLPSVASGYGYDVNLFPYRSHGLGLRYMRPIFDRVDLFLAMSEDMRGDLVALGFPEAKVRVHYHGSNTSRFRWPERAYVRDGSVNILHCARLIDGKGQELVLEGLRRLDQRGHHEFRVTFVGDGPARARYEAMADAYGLKSRVTFAGHVPHASHALVEHYRDADIFAHPSSRIPGPHKREGIPGTIVEAMASGLPVLSTRHAGIPEVIADRRHGLLVEEHDAAGVADALEELLDDADLRRRLGEAAARRAADELDLHTRTAELERIYDELI